MIMYRASIIIKRVLDIIVSGVALIVFCPFFLVLGILIKLDSKGPIFFKQERRGKDGKIFKMYKFRSMVVNAENMGTGLFNYKGDPRVTRIGSFMRKTSLDELPQFINVLNGTMSFVGPRPSVTYELGDYDTLNQRYKKRFQVTPGITGLAQISGRNNISWDEKVNLDNKYIEEFKKKGVLFDIYILTKTVWNVFIKKNIYEEKLEEGLSDIESAVQAEKEIIRKAHEPETIIEE